MPNLNPASPRMTFQWRYFETAAPPLPDGRPDVLNIGSADDPLGFKDGALHYDIDDWSYTNKWFKQGDAHQLPFPDQSFDTVIMGDIHEHLRDPLKATLEAARVARRILVMTIFEEWRLPGHGQFIAEGTALGDKTSQDLGYKDRQDYQVKVFPKRVGFDDDVEPHLVHINAFNDDDIEKLILAVMDAGFRIGEMTKVHEATHEGHPWFNWLIAMERVR